MSDPVTLLRAALERLLREAEEETALDPHTGPSEEAMQQARTALAEPPTPDVEEYDTEAGPTVQQVADSEASLRAAGRDRP